MRHHDWPEHLANYIASRRKTPFAWGAHDCCKFAAGAVEAMTGTDPMAHFDYSDEASAQALIAAAGGLEHLVTETLGEPLPSLGQVKRGDVVMADLDHGPTVGVSLGNVCAYAAPIGVLLLRTGHARLAWRIG